MRSKKVLAILVVTLLTTSFVVYAVHFMIFRDFHHIAIYGLGDIAIMPIEVLIVTIIIERLLAASERQAMLGKLNMVIGAFFSEVGTGFMKLVFPLDSAFEKNRRNFIVRPEWTDRTFEATKKSVTGYEYHIKVTGKDLIPLKDFLVGKREFLLRLLENPNLLEHEDFTDALWPIFHLTEELDARKDLTRLTEADYDHLATDIRRAYEAVLTEWIDYMKHLKKSYPYLFAMAVRTNPFDPEAQAEIA